MEEADAEKSRVRRGYGKREFIGMLVFPIC